MTDSSLGAGVVGNEHRAQRDDVVPVHQDFVMGEQPIPLVDLVTRAKVMDAGTDLITVVAIYAVSLLATTGFVVSAVVEEVRRPRRFRQTSSRAKT